MRSWYQESDNQSSQSSTAFALHLICGCTILAAQLVLVLCSVCVLTMSSIPQGAFAAMSVRHNDSKKERHSNYPPVNKKLVEPQALRYNSKMMNSVWGQYNRYSVHNMKKNTDQSKEVLLWAEQRLATATPPAYHAPGFTPNFFK